MSNQTWPELIHEVQPKFNQIAETHKLVLWKAESQFAIQALQSNKGLADCVPYTVQNAIINVASVGLTLNPADGYAYLVPEYNKATNQKECQLRISFKGLVKLATDSGAISWVKAEIVKENDTFEYRGISQEPSHIMQPFGDRGNTVGVYCVAKTNDGEYLVDTMPKVEIDLIRKCAKFDTVWAQWYDEMAKKAIIKRASKQWPRTNKSSMLHKAVEIINETEGSDPNYMIFTPEQEDGFVKAVESEDPLTYMAFCESIAGGTKSEPGLNSEIVGALIQAYKQRFKESKEMTKKGEMIRELAYQGSQMMIASVEEIIEYSYAGNLSAIKEIFDNFDEYGLKNKLWNAIEPKDQDRISELKRTAA